MPAPAAPSRLDVEEQLARILASPSFNGSPRLSAFLEFIVRKELAGEGEQIKGYTIGVEIYGKPPSFNPEADSTVRVEAIRLRKTLAQYYHHEGQSDPVVLVVAKGSYRPSFSFLQPANEATATATLEPNLPQASLPYAPLPPGQSMVTHTGNYIVTILSVTLLLAALGFMLFDAPIGSNHDYETAAQDVYPTVAIFPFALELETAEKAELEPLDEHILTKLNFFHTLKVASSNNIKGGQTLDMRSLDYARELGADYLIEGTLTLTQKKLKVRVKLLDTDVKNYVWSTEESYDWPEGDKTALIDHISTLIVSQIASPYGALETVQRLKLERNPNIFSQNLSCVLGYQAYSNRKNPQDHAKIRACLEKAVEADPNYSDGWAALSWIYGDEVRMGYNLQGSEEDANKRALNAGERAVATDPRNARAHQYMALAAQAVGLNPLVRQHTDMALALNPYDSEVVADAAWVACQLEEWERCRELGLKAMQINPLHPDWYNFALFIYHFHKGEYAESVPYATKYYQPDFLFSNLLLAAAQAKSGNSQDAQKLANQIRDKFPDFTNNPLAVFKPWGLAKPLVEKIIAGVEAAGLPLEMRK
jgi:adenylate cyclase